MLGVGVPGAGPPRLCLCAHARCRGQPQEPGVSCLQAGKMASAMLVLVLPPWPSARGLLRNCLERLQRNLPQSRLGFPSLPSGPALAVQGPAIVGEQADDTSGSKEISSLLDGIFWMAAPKNRRSIEVNRCRRRNPQKLIKVKRQEQSVVSFGPGIPALRSCWNRKTKRQSCNTRQKCWQTNAGSRGRRSTVDGAVGQEAADFPV
nr:39S ribosomal protein L32, mitochondrial isoform X2 [Loxodonta africana]